MECNKEEAIRAKSIAESRMQSQDFEGALKIALKAQRLFPNLESISQILTVCEVHCASATKIGGETDWYAVLQVEMTADEPTIRKQYRKLALLLHPDKNKLVGAENAFQLVGDAYKILSDPQKRSQHNVIRRANFSKLSFNQAARQSYRPSAKKQPGPGVSSTAAKSNFAHFGGLNQSKPSPFLGSGAFWTMCPSCSVRFQYFQYVLNKQVRCQRCFNRFVAYDLKAKDLSSTGNLEKVENIAPSTCLKSECADASTMEVPRANLDTSALNQGFKPEQRPQIFGASKSNLRDGKTENNQTICNDLIFQNVQFHSIHNSDHKGKPIASQKKRRNEDNQTPEPTADKASSILRRSNRHKQNVNCDEFQGSCVNSLPPAYKRSRQREKRADWVQNNNESLGVITDEKGEESGNRHIRSEFNASAASGCKTSVDPANLTYPSPEFCNFESERSENKFAADQIWALYDNIDGMPRFYARVRKVYSREFKLQLNWLEMDPRTIDEMKWSKEGLPVACGNFKHGKSYNTQEPHFFSHLVSWRKGVKKNSYMIHPRKGEIWALFKNWDIRWSHEPDNHRAYEYQVVEVVSDFTEVNGISVIRLAKIKEFMALFVRASDAEESLLEIPAKDVLVFSHRIPACRITGKEEDGVPDGTFELDCASLPTNFRVNFPSISLVSKKRSPNVGVVCNDVDFTCENKIPQTSMENGFENNEQDAMEKLRSGTRGFASKMMNDVSETVHINSNGWQDTLTGSQMAFERETKTLRNEAITKADNIGSQNADTEPSLLVFEYPSSEFYDFESDRLMEKFECGQVWAFYCEIDNYPKYYGRLRKVDRENNQVHVRWLEFFSESDVDDHCAEDKPPSACGTFRAIKETCKMDSSETFSHQVKAKPMVKKDHYYIFPDVGEVWAVIRNWSAKWSASDLKNSDFEVVEITARDANGIKAFVLTKVDGYVSVFRRESEGLDTPKIIPLNECMRFSHQIPAVKLERVMLSGGYWELDPAAVPTVFLT
ncbi:uncharacterized protein LOC110032735 [Phalaenopsis equestris]|uniref:uncharacterized protein LOC110032735 n=1 Tax=Phalaenopsis equestris TaxID=78828 RepID=UPI0009E22E64|nr:uncharacterized protein LOC110032735 [Phalaenopsis equestris]